MTWSPRQEAAKYPEIMVHRCSLEEGTGWWSPAYQVILLEESLDPISERCVMAHELGHALLGHCGVDEDIPQRRFFARRIEAAADAWADSRLVAFADLAQVLGMYAGEISRVAAELEVTPAVLGRRLARLGRTQREILEQQAAAVDHAA